jgi:sugar phosphate isomerase/epimerase
MKVTIQEARGLLAPFAAMKQKFPFRLGTTSYIYPGEILPNVEILSDCVDEIQLLLFEGNTFSNIPDPPLIDRLRKLADEKRVTYSVHLPLDAYPGHPDEEIRMESVRMIRRIHEVGVLLGCKYFIFHYASRNPEGEPIGDRELWRNQLAKSTEELLSSGIRAESLCVENLAYPYSWVADLVEKYGLSKCIDIGHLRVNGHPVGAHLLTHMAATKVIHLHGLKNGGDHKGLSILDQKSVRELFQSVNQHEYRESIILEVFQLDHLLESLETFRELWNQWQAEN